VSTDLGEWESNSRRGGRISVTRYAGGKKHGMELQITQIGGLSHGLGDFINISYDDANQLIKILNAECNEYPVPRMSNEQIDEMDQLKRNIL